MSKPVPDRFKNPNVKSMTRFRARSRKSRVQAKGEKELNLSLNLYSKI